LHYLVPQLVLRTPEIDLLVNQFQPDVGCRNKVCGCTATALCGWVSCVS